MWKKTERTDKLSQTKDLRRPSRAFGTLVMLLVVALIATACGSESDSADTTNSGEVSETGETTASTAQSGDDDQGPTGTLVVGVPSLGSETWNFRTSTTDEQQILDMVGDTLIRRNPDTLELEPGLAESWELSEDGLTWTFRLHEGVPFHDDWGTLTSEDVAFTWEQNLLEDCTHTRCGVYRDAIDGDMANFEIVNETEFRIHTPELQALLPQELAHGQVVMNILSKEYWDEVGEEEAIAHPVGTGPFRFVSQERGSQVTLGAVSDHWRQTPSFETVIVRIVPEEASRLAQVQSGDLDLAPIGSSQKPEAETAGLNTYSIPGVGTSSMIFGGSYPGHENYDEDAPWIQMDNPEAGKAIREALTLAIDRETILENIVFGEGDLMPAPLSFLPGPYPWNDSSWTVPEYDPERAQELLAEGGYPDGFEIDSPIFPQAGRPASEDIAEAVAGMFEAIGLTVNRQPMDFQPTFRTFLVERTTAGMVYQFTAPSYPEPVIGLRVAYMPEGPLAHMHHPALTDLVPQILSEGDFDARMELTREMGQRLSDDFAAVPIVSVNLLYVGSENIGDWTTVAGVGALHNVEYATHGN